MARNETAALPARVAGGRSVAFGEFHLERVFAAPLARVWNALTEPEAKARWFAGTAGSWQVLERQMDVRVGGRERLKVTEQGAFLDGFDDAGSREHGTAKLLDALGASLT